MKLFSQKLEIPKILDLEVWEKLNEEQTECVVGGATDKVNTKNSKTNLMTLKVPGDDSAAYYLDDSFYYPLCAFSLPDGSSFVTHCNPATDFDPANPPPFLPEVGL